ncbi:MAG TPA: DUF3300 domain-containing protein [Bauldia sp.]|nr:DUF3300 domain-containing protein [Bauldia sp.]
MRAALMGVALSILLMAAGTAAAQEQPAGTAAPPAATESPTPGTSAPTLGAAQLAQLVAPIALYPDQLLSDVLMASTYPIEIVEADRWYEANKSLTGTALTSALDQQSWHASVKSLIATPTVLEMMNDQLGWTQQLGTAVLNQQADVMSAVQALRAKAHAANQLQSTKEQTVSLQSEGTDQVIVIEPATAGVIYVPYYNPAVVYGAWAWPNYLPYYWPPPVGYVVGPGIVFGAGFFIGDPIWHGYWGGYWGGFDWWHGNMVIHQTVVVNGNVHVNVNKWEHDGNDKAENFSNTYRGDPNAYSGAAKQNFQSALDQSGGGAEKSSDDIAKEDNLPDQDHPGIGDQTDKGYYDDTRGDAFGGYGGYRSDYGDGGFRGGDWGGGGYRHHR